MAKKLYNVTIMFEYAVLAENGHGATSFAEEAFGDSNVHEHCQVVEVSPDPAGEVSGPPSWDDEALVYGAGDEDVTLAEAIEKYVKKPESV